MAFLDVDSVRLHYLLERDSHKPVIVFSHGLGMNLRLWEPQVAAFSRHFQVLRYDQRGHGRSSVPTGPYSMDDFGADLLRLLDSLGIENCNFCGLSLGGMLGQWLGLHAPSRLRHLVLCNTAARIGTDESWNTRIAKVREAGLEAVLPAVLERWFTPDFRANSPQMVARIREMPASTNAAGYTAACVALRDTDFRESISGIAVSTLVVAGRHDQVTSPADGRFLASTIPEASYSEVDAAHLSNVEAAESFNSVVTDFLLS